MKNSMEVKFKAIPENVAFARSVIVSFIVPLNPSVDEISDVKTAVSEAVTNVIVHAYPDKPGYITMKAKTYDNRFELQIIDTGVGIPDIERALSPFYTSKPDEERSGLGFTIMKSFMDKLEVKNNTEGVTVFMSKELTDTVAG